MNRKRFTLIELLAVMAIMAVLAAALLAALGGMRDVAKRRQSETEMNNIAATCNQFYLDYRQLPAKYIEGSSRKDCVYLGKESGSDPVVNTSWSPSADMCVAGKALRPGYLQLFDVLCATNLEGGTSEDFVLTSENARSFNERCVQYIKPKPHYFDSDKTTQGFRDPWERPYLIMFDTGYNLKIDYPAYLVSTSSGNIMERVAVLCYKWEDDAKSAADNFSKIGKPMPHSWKD